MAFVSPYRVPVVMLLLAACSVHDAESDRKENDTSPGRADGRAFGEASYFSCAAPSRKESDWWKTVTTFSSGRNPLKDADIVHPDAVRGLAFQSGWYGYWAFAEQRRLPSNTRKWRKAHEQGLRRVLYYDGGEVGDYAIFTDRTGAVVGNGWNLPTLAPDGDLTARWFGLDAFLSNVGWAPYATADTYGVAPFTMADGKENKGVYDAIAARTLDDEWQFLQYSNASITDKMAHVSGLDRLSEYQTAAEDVSNKSGWVISRLVHEDFADPELARYHADELDMLIKMLRPDGVHIDNFGDANIAYPHLHAFGVWARARFRDWLRERFSPSELTQMGVDNLAHFDVRDYVVHEMKSMGADRDEQTSNELWTKDPVWLSYLVFLSETAAEYHRSLYDAAKQTAAALGSDLMVGGNLIPVWPGAMLVRGACDLAIFEWWTTKGFGASRPMGLPPFARIGYVTRLASHLCSASYSVPNLYVSSALSGDGHENLHKVLAMDALANGGVLDYGYQFLDGYAPGTAASAAFIDAFVSAHAERLSNRRYLPEVALVYSDWSEIASITVQSIMPEKTFAEYAGWATYLSHGHRQWDVLPADDADLQRLSDFPIVVLPSVSVLTDEQVTALHDYVRNGGHLVVTGDTGSREGPERSLRPRATDALSDLVSRPNVHVTSERPGAAYWETSGGGSDRLHALLDFPDLTPALVTDAPETVGVDLGCAYEAGAHELTIDLVNYALAPESDVVTPTPDVTVTIKVPDGWAGSTWRAIGFQAEDAAAPEPLEVRPGAGSITVRVPTFRFSTLVNLEPTP